MELGGEEGLISRLEKSKNNIVVLIISDESYLNWQNPNEVRTYIKSNWKLVETIDAFDVYSKKEGN